MWKISASKESINIATTSPRYEKPNHRSSFIDLFCLLPRCLCPLRSPTVSLLMDLLTCDMHMLIHDRTRIGCLQHRYVLSGSLVQQRKNRASYIVCTITLWHKGMELSGLQEGIMHHLHDCAAPTGRAICDRVAVTMIYSEPDEPDEPLLQPSRLPHGTRLVLTFSLLNQAM